MGAVETERDGRVLIVRVDNPPRNLMDRGLVADLTALLRSVEGDPTLGAVVVTGKPADLFITHYDVAEMVEGAEQGMPQVSASVAGASYRALSVVARLPGAKQALRRTPAGGTLDLQALHGLFTRMERLDKAVIAAINGQALSIGCEFSLACDIRYMADDARAIGLPEMTLGVMPGGGGTQRLSRAVGQARALELILEARCLTPAEALEAGIVHRVVPHAELLEAAVETGHRLARRPNFSTRAVKRAVLDGASRPLPVGLATERSWWLAAAVRPPARRAMQRYVDDVRRSERLPWEDEETREAWRQGTVVDLIGPDD